MCTQQNLAHATSMTRDAMHRSLRWYEHTDLAWQNTQVTLF